MANVGKIYDDCNKLDFFFNVIDDGLFVQEVVFVGQRGFQINGYLVEV